MNVACIYRWRNNLTLYFLNTNLDLERNITHSIVYLIWLKNGDLSLDQNWICEALLTDLSKAFDCLPHHLLIAKVHAYGCDLTSLKCLNSYLRNRHQRLKINNLYNSLAEILFEVPQGFIVCPMLFNIFLCNLFLFIKNKDVTSNADDTTPYETGEIHMLYMT